VKSFAPNAYGLYDLSGNVLEWCADWHTERYDGPRTGVGVLRGGSWAVWDGVTDLRASVRFGASRQIAHDDFGFRCTRSVP
jgi:sulfatase modifying factor 1